MRTKPSDGVVLVAVIAWISGILQLFSGAVMLFSGGSPVTGWLHIVIGVVTFPVCLGLFRARTSARIIVTAGVPARDRGGGRRVPRPQGARLHRHHLGGAGDLRSCAALHPCRERVVPGCDGGAEVGRDGGVERALGPLAEGDGGLRAARGLQRWGHVDKGRARALHRVRVRSSGHGAAARHPAAARSALAHPHRGVLARDQPQRALHQLAAGSVRQLAGADRLPREGQPPRDHRRARRRHDGRQSARLLHRVLCRAIPVPLPAGPRRGPRALPPAGRRERSRRRVDDGSPVAPRRRRADREVPRRPQSGGVPGCRVQPAHGGRRPDPRPHPRIGHRVLSRQCLAAREHPAPVRARRTLRVGVPRAARTRPRRTGRAGGSDRGLHRSARLGRGVRPRRRLDRPRPHERPLRR